MAQIELVEEFARVEAAVGWCAMIAAAASYSCGFLQPDAAKRWFGQSDACLAGQLQPTGRAERVDGGYVVSGPFRFGSGIRHATMVLAGCLVTRNGGPVRDERGRPELRTIIVPSQVQVLDNWDTVGLRATDSNDYILDVGLAGVENSERFSARCTLAGADGTADPFASPMESRRRSVETERSLRPV